MPIIRPDERRGLHTIEDDLSETWVEDWAAVGLAELEALLAKHAAFLGFLETQPTTQVPAFRPRVEAETLGAVKLELPVPRLARPPASSRR